MFMVFMMITCETNFSIFLVSMVYHILRNYYAVVPKKICTLDILHLKQDFTQNFKSQHLSSIHIISCCSIWNATHFMALTAVAHATTAHLLLSNALGQQHWLLRWWESSHRFVGVEDDSQYIRRLNLGDVMRCVSGTNVYIRKNIYNIYIYLFIYAYRCVYTWLSLKCLEVGQVLFGGN